MKITVALVSACVGLSISRETGQTISKRSLEPNTVVEGFLAPEAAFYFEVDCDGLPFAGNCPLAKWLMINLGKH